MNTGRTVVITGAAGGMGRPFVRRFLDNGDTVLATDRSDEALEQLRAALPSERLFVRAADIAKAEDCQALASLARQRTGRVDVLVNVAGYFPVRGFLDMSVEDWREIIDINLTGTALMCRAMLPLMIGRGWGRIPARWGTRHSVLPLHLEKPGADFGFLQLGLRVDGLL